MPHLAGKSLTAIALGLGLPFLLLPWASQAKTTDVKILLGPSTSGIELVKKVVAQWDKLETGIRVKIEVGSAIPTETILTRAAGGVLPDLYLDMAPTNLATFLKAGIMYPLDKFPDYKEVVRNRGCDETAKEYMAKGHAYLLPWQIETTQLSWNVDLLKRAGLSGVPPATYSEFLEAGKKLKGMKIPLMVLGGSGHWTARIGDFYSIYLAAGGRSLLTNGKSNMSSPLAIQSMKLFLDMKQLGLTGGGDWYTGKLGTGIFGLSQMLLDNKAKFEWTATPFVVPDNYSGAQPPGEYANLKGLVMFYKSPHKAEAWRFAKYYIGEVADQISLSYGRLPVRDAMLNQPDFAAFFKQRPKLVPFVNQLRNVKGLDIEIKIEDMMLSLDNAWDRSVLREKITIEQALDEASRKINSLHKSL